MKKIGVREFNIQEYKELKELSGEIPEYFLKDRLISCLLVEGEILKDYKLLSDYFILGNSEAAIQKFENIKSKIKHQINGAGKELQQELTDLFMETEWLIHDHPQRDAEYYKAQIMANAELVFSFSLYMLLKAKNISVFWLDSRDIIKATEEFPVGKLIENYNQSAIENLIPDLVGKTTITQGRIASTMDNENTLLKENPWKFINN